MMISGNAITTSKIRWKIRSSRPPKYALATPSTRPAKPPTMAEVSPTISAVRAPKMMRDSRSRPNWSVPSQWVQLGASVIAAKSFAVGLYGAISSAETPVPASISASTAPNAPRGARRQKCSVACQYERCSSIVSSAGSAIGVFTVVDMTRSPSGEADARIEPRVHQVDDRVAEQEDGAGEHHQPLGQRVVLVLHGLHEQPAD